LPFRVVLPNPNEPLNGDVTSRSLSDTVVPVWVTVVLACIGTAFTPPPVNVIVPR
jgi:hypothetical protein